MLQRLIWSTVFLSLVLITLGGVVHNTESSLACPDWPLCFGQLLPEMKGGVAIEHSHRLLASLVGLLTVGILVVVERRRSEYSDIVVWARLALGLVLAQGLLGGITVLWKLPTLISTAHLATSMAFYCVLLLMAVRSTKAARVLACNVEPLAASPLRWLVVAGVAVYLQMILGALVRHTGSGAAAGLGASSVWTGIDLGGGEKDLWPSDGPGRLNMAHRYAALLVFGIVVAASRRAFTYARARADAIGQRLAAAAILLTASQMLLGAASLWRFLSIPLVTAHLTVAALVLSALLLLRMRLARVPVTFAGTSVAGSSGQR
jgi:heme A synthase